VVPAVASAIVPGIGQFINGDVDKGIGVLITAAVAGAGFWVGLPLLGTVAGFVYGATWVYAVADGYLTGRRK
jgi:TM2 domain-containing membrane protein YozV